MSDMKTNLLENHSGTTTQILATSVCTNYIFLSVKEKPSWTKYFWASVILIADKAKSFCPPSCYQTQPPDL